MTEEIVHAHHPLEEPIDIVNVQVRSYVVVRDNNLEFEEFVEFDDNWPLVLWDWFAGRG